MCPHTRLHMPAVSAYAFEWLLRRFRSIRAVYMCSHAIHKSAIYVSSYAPAYALRVTPPAFSSSSTPAVEDIYIHIYVCYICVLILSATPPAVSSPSTSCMCSNYLGLVAAITENIHYTDWNSAKTACDELILNGYSDWHLPSKEELNSVYVNLKKVGVGGFEDYSYWSSTEYDNGYAWVQSFDNGNQGNANKGLGGVIFRAVRAF